MEYKARCINFELWFLDEQEQDIDRIYHTLEILIKRDINQAVLDGCNTIIGLLLYEGFLYKNSGDFYALLDRVHAYGRNKGIVKFLLACGIAWNYQNILDGRNLDYEILEFDYSANAMWESYKSFNLPPWNSDANKYLFLGGVPSRKNRITLLSHFYDHDMLNDYRAIWSFFPPTDDNEKIQCRSLCSHYTDEKYLQFIKKAENKVDVKYHNAKEYSKASGKEWKIFKYLDSDFFQDPNYIDQKIFQSTAISVIAEGYVYPPANDFKFLTEKTWRAVVNRHPFILADCEDRKNFARERGLDLFEDYFVSDYDNRDNLMGVVKNVQHFLQNKSSNVDTINQKVNANLAVFFKIINTNEQLLHKLETTYNVPVVELSKWFRQKSFDHLFRIPEFIK